jgi:hypothetical protein
MPAMLGMVGVVALVLAATATSPARRPSRAGAAPVTRDATFTSDAMFTRAAALATDATFTSAALWSPSTNPVSRALYSMDGPHEGPMAGVPATFSWSSHPVVESVQPPAGWDSATAWGVVYADANDASSEPPQGSARVELRDMQLHVWSDTQSAWLQVQGTAPVTGAHYLQDFAGNANVPADLRAEADGGVSSALIAGYNLHVWPSGDRPALPVPGSEIGAVYVTVQARLIGPGASSGRYLLGVGADWWQTPTAAFPANAGIGTGRFMYLSESWASYDFWTGGDYSPGPPGWTDAQMTAHPPQSPFTALAVTHSGGGAWAAQVDGAVRPGGDATGFGSPSSLASPVVGIAETPDGGGYWLATADGGVFTFGDARFRGSAGALRLAQPVVGIAATPDGGGYWLVAADGGIFAFGDAHFFGSTGALRLAQPVVGIAATPDGGGYWLVAADGGIFSFGDARFMGSGGALHLAEPVVGIAPTPDGGGYWLVAADGGIFSFGDAEYEGSAAGGGLGAPVTAIVAAPDGGGYWVQAADGAVLDFGSAQPLSR